MSCSREEKRRRRCPGLEHVVREGPVLVLDIDGVCSPHSGMCEKSGKKENRFERRMPPPGWGGQGQDNRHHLLSSWMTEFEGAHRRILWIPGAGRRGCREYARAAGHAPAMDWPFIPYFDHKLQGLNRWIAGDVPVAVLDDDFCTWKNAGEEKFLARRIRR